jgi:YbbR domain-containing protein
MAGIVAGVARRGRRDTMMQFFTETLGWRFLLALILSSTMWARLTLEQNPQRQDEFPTDIPIEVRSLPPGLVLANELPSVKVQIAAPQASWQSLRGSSFRASIDLAGARPGLTQPDVSVEVSDPDVRVLLVQPSKVTVRVEEVRTVSVPVRLTQLGSVPFGFRVVSEPTIVPPAVEVSGPSSAVEKVTEAEVSVRMEEAKTTVDRSLQPEPRGPTGVVSGVRVQPQSVTVTIQIEQIAGSKSVSVVPQVRGQPAPGYWQSAITVEPPTVQIVGEPPLLETISVLNTADIDVAGAAGDVVRSVPILRPPGVTVVRDQPATVRVVIQPLSGQQVRDSAIVVQNVDPALQATVAPPTVSVTLSGPQPTLARLTPADVVVSIDASGLPAGTHTLTPTSQVPEGVRADRLVPNTVTLTLVARPPEATTSPSASPAPPAPPG